MSITMNVVLINFYNILDATQQSSNLEFSHITRRVLFITNRELGQHPTRPQGTQYAGILSTLLLLLHSREEPKKGGTSAPHCASQLYAITLLVPFNYLANGHQTGRRGWKVCSGCVPICALKVKEKKRQTPPEQEKTPLCQWFSGCKPKSGCFFHAVYRRGYSLLLPLQITACLADLNIAIKLFPSFCLRHYCAAEASGLIAHGGRCCPIHLPLPLHCSGRNRGLVWRVCVTTRGLTINFKSTTAILHLNFNRVHVWHTCSFN